MKYEIKKIKKKNFFEKKNFTKLPKKLIINKWEILNRLKESKRLLLKIIVYW